MNDIEQTLRDASRDARRVAASAIDLDADLAATLQRPTSERGDGSESSSAGHRVLVVSAAAALIVFLIGGMLLIARSESGVDPAGPVSSSPTSPSNVAVVPSTAPATPLEPLLPSATTAPVPQDSVPPDTTATPDVESVTVPVSYLDPPPLYSPVPFATIERPASADEGFQFAVGDGIIVVTGDDTNVHVLDTVTGTTTRRQLAVRVALPVFGPGNVLYGVSYTPPSSDAVSQMPDAAIVAQPIRDEPIEVVDSTSVDANTYLEPPLGTLVAGPDGIYDVERARGRVTDYVGSETFDVPVPPLIDREPTDGTIVRSGDQTAQWTLNVDQHPNAAVPFVGERPAAPGPNGTTRVVRYIGPRLEAEPVDFGTPTNPVIADLQPGTGQWWTLPDDWTVVESSTRGTLLVRDTGDQFELAWFEPDN
jgi:hypothetical protein